jgi:uroporphyrinogen decarboxylase
MNQTEFYDFGTTYDLRILSETADLWLNMLHIHGQEIMFKEVADYPVQIINWHDRENTVSLADGLRRVGGAVSGGVSRSTLYEESPAGTLAEANGAMEQTGGRRFMLGVGCVAMSNTPLRNIRALREFVDQ